jgi:hypothetical protein
VLSLELLFEPVVLTGGTERRPAVAADLRRLGCRRLRRGSADLDPDVVFVVRHPFPEAVETAGSDGIRQYMRRFLDNWESYAVEARDQAVGDVVTALHGMS